MFFSGADTSLPLEEKTCFSLGVRVHNSSVCVHVMNVSERYHSYRRCETQQI